MQISTTIKLPCKARALEEAIRRLCEPHGLYDTAVVKAEVKHEKDSWDDFVYLNISAEDNK